jgi:hypothetical protein
LFILLIFGEECRLWSSSCSFVSNLLSLHLSLVQIFSNTFSLCSFLNVRDKVSHPYRTTGKIIILYILILMFLESRWEDIRFWTEW